MFITFEGIDGSGKTTQSRLLTEYLSGVYGVDNVILTREPGGTFFNESVRNLLFSTKNLDKLSELLFFIAMRREHFMKVIKPALTQQKIVICDRFIDSTIAYQGYGHGIDCKLIEELNDLVVDIYPNITFVLDSDINQSVARSNKNGYEFLDLEFYARVRDGFRDIVKRNQYRCYLITNVDATKNINEISAIYLKTIKILHAL